MTFSLKPTSLAVKAVLLSSTVLSSATFANYAPDAIDDIEVITIKHQRHQSLSDNESFAQGKTSEPDLANWLTSVPGANVNSNGPVTGIAQYRGLYGDRVSATLDGHALIGAGPNSMDTPLSYSTPLIVESMTVYRGIAPVSAGMNTLGGAIDVRMRKAESSSGDKLQLNGDLQAGYRSNNQAGTFSSVVNMGKNDKGLLLYANWQAGDDMESGDSVDISPTEFEKRQFGGDLRFTQSDSEYGFSYHYTDTQDSGTPALPMDIEYIFSHRVNIDGNFMLGNWQTDWQLGYLDADHGMTNFLMRQNNDMMRYRRNNAAAETVDFKVTFEQSFDFGDIRIGADGYFAEHDSVITNPNNAMFEVINFNGVKDDRYGLFVEWQQKYDNTTVQLGARLKTAKADAEQVATSMAMMSMPMMGDDMDSDMDMDMDSDMGSGVDMMMPSMAELASELRDNFNAADRSVSDTNLDVALSIQTQFDKHTSWYFGLGVKNRAPSYQERYLWTPMEATGGLADGHTYIGDINLDSETAYQSDIGLTFQNDTFMVAPHIFYQRIDDYIQGTPMTMMDMSAQMMAQMMSGDESPLKFSNVDAKLSGADMNWYINVSDQVRLSGVVSYVNGERRDIEDSLYRIAPLNAQVSVSYQGEKLLSRLTLVAAAKQDDVSETNKEQETKGYGVVNLDLQYFVNNDLTVRAGIDNLFNKDYQNHLGGYNRVKGTEIPTMSRLPSEGVSAWAEVTYSF